MKYLLIPLFVISFCSLCFSQVDIEIYGSLQKMMHENDTSEKVRVNLMGPISDYYGLGAVAGLDGEILILNGETYVTRTWEDGSLTTDKSTDVGAALLVVAPVLAWDTLKVGIGLNSLAELETYLKSNIRQGSPFPFMIVSKRSRIQWHVINRPKSSEEMKNHKEMGASGKYSGEATIFGFFSENHEGIFTHRGQKTHIHFQSVDKLYAGHVDEIEIKKGDKLLIAK